LKGFLKGFRGSVRDELGGVWLRQRGGLIRKSGRSVVRGLGIDASERMLKLSGLWYRELWYVNSVPADRFGRELRLPVPPTKLEGQVKIPPGWRRVSAREARSRGLVSQETEFFDELIDLAWMPGNWTSSRKVNNEYYLDLQAGGMESRWSRWKRKSVPRFGVVACKSRLRSSFWYRLVRPVREEMVWVKDIDRGGLLELSLLPFAVYSREEIPRPRPIHFRFGGVEVKEIGGVLPVVGGVGVPEVKTPLRRSSPLAGPSVRAEILYLRHRLTKRCDVDPEVVEFVDRCRAAGLMPGRPSSDRPALWAPPDCLTMSSWLEAEERAAVYVQ